MSKKLDFLIIGAQKSATTALFRYLQNHKQIAMPAEKEAPLFTSDVTSAQIDAFINLHFDCSDQDAEPCLRGKATPQYMCDKNVPSRIFGYNPNMKLIAVLREPIDRAWSQYRMNLRRETEGRTFDTAVEELLNENYLSKARTGVAPSHQSGYEAEGDFYLAWSEYGRILHNYTEYFQSQQLLIIYTQELEKNPGAAMDKVLSFLDLEPGYRPDILGERVHQGGNAQLIPNSFKEQAKNIPLIRRIWDKFPDHKKGLIRYWYEQINVKKSEQSPELSTRNRERLKKHFGSDAILIEQITGKRPDWIGV